ncbi:PREDICTED: spermatogenesis-associated protein 17 [Sturnus vulgaris]|uniref:spermatogenesis-associated protein 17 n=1 Tax=Sturnus vulgaris TaxID=9172 RepID=UPI00071AAB28|nr:PREDICTED: spermatogenesis-associated protein 17 [Sturnus vulgaris]
MAALARLEEKLQKLREEYFLTSRAIDEDRKTKYVAALKIQRWFRACRVRAYLRHLSKMATLIQKWWRGYLRRKNFREVVERAYFIRKLKFYNEMAVRIQKMWRGYYVRKYIHNFYALKKYLEAVSVNNELVRSELQEYAEMKENEEKMKDLEKKEKEKKYQARKMHYLLSTEQIPGIYNSPFRKSPDPMELLLRKSKPLTHRKQKMESSFADELYDWPTCKKPPAFVTALPLLPADRQKPQGPFRDPAEVLKQRYKPLEPTLRVRESMNSTPAKAREATGREEWRSPIHDNEFLPFSSYHKKAEKYEPSLCKSGKYGREAYGTKHFREVYPKKWIAERDFETLFSSIVLFEKFGKTYSSTGQIA